MRKYEDSTIGLIDNKGRSLDFYVKNAAEAARFLKIWDNFSNCANSGAPVYSEIVEIPTIRRLLSVKILIKTYGVDE